METSAVNLSKKEKRFTTCSKISNGAHAERVMRHDAHKRHMSLRLPRAFSEQLFNRITSRSHVEATCMAEQ